MKTNTAPPVHVAWEITRRCNARCLHCSSASGPDSFDVEPDTSNALHIIDQLADAGVRVLAFSGGEPLLRDDLATLIQHAVKRGLTTNVCTNGSLLEAQTASSLKAAGLHSITVSLDAANPEIHDRLRHFPGLFHRAASAISALVRNGHRVGVSFTPTSVNYQESSEVVQRAWLLGAHSVCFSQYIPTGRGTRDLMLSPETLGFLATQVTRLQVEYARRLQVLSHDCHLALLLPPEERQAYKGCGAGTDTAGIRANGAVTPCIFMSKEAGNLNKTPFAEIWDTSPDLLSMRDRELLKQGNCGSCPFRDVCGGCRAAAMAIHQDPLAGDPSCWLFPDPTLGGVEITA